jgi:hypothetical protein
MIDGKVFRGVLFDTGGVVTDTARLHLSAWRRLFHDLTEHGGNQSATGDVPGPQGSRRDSSAGDEPLRSNLKVAFPGALGLFSLDNPITLAFLRRFPTAAKASRLSPARLERWLRSVGYSGVIAA